MAFRKVTGPQVATAWRGRRTENKNYPDERGWRPWREVGGYARDIKETAMMGLGGR